MSNLSLSCTCPVSCQCLIFIRDSPWCFRIIWLASLRARRDGRGSSSLPFSGSFLSVCAVLPGPFDWDDNDAVSCGEEDWQCRTVINGIFPTKALLHSWACSPLFSQRAAIPQFLESATQILHSPDLRSKSAAQTTVTGTYQNIAKHWAGAARTMQKSLLHTSATSTTEKRNYNIGKPKLDTSSSIEMSIESKQQSMSKSMTRPRDSTCTKAFKVAMGMWHYSPGTFPIFSVRVDQVSVDRTYKKFESDLHDLNWCTLCLRLFSFLVLSVFVLLSLWHSTRQNCVNRASCRGCEASFSMVVNAVNVCVVGGPWPSRRLLLLFHSDFIISLQNQMLESRFSPSLLRTGVLCVTWPCPAFRKVLVFQRMTSSCIVLTSWPLEMKCGKIDTSTKYLSSTWTANFWWNTRLMYSFLVMNWKSSGRCVCWWSTHELENPAGRQWLWLSCHTVQRCFLVDFI